MACSEGGGRWRRGQTVLKHQHNLQRGLPPRFRCPRLCLWQIHEVSEEQAYELCRRTEAEVLREIWKGDEQLGRSNKRELEIRRPRRKQAQEREAEEDASGHWEWAGQNQHCHDRHLRLSVRDQALEVKHAAQGHLGSKQGQ